MIRRIAVLLLLSGALGAPMISVDAADAAIPPDTQCRRGKVALTFDDGPHKTFTPKLLKILREHRTQATFFVQGQNAKRHPAMLRRMVRDGHAVENHSWDHPRLDRLSPAQLRKQLTRTTAEIRRATGQRAHFFRPPYGATNQNVRTIAASVGLAQKLWTIDTRDWAGRNSDQIRKAVADGVRPRRFNNVLMHDAVGNSAKTVAAVPGIIKDLRRKKYCLVPLETMTPLASVSAPDRRFVEPPDRVRRVRVPLKLDSRAQRRGSVRVTTIDGTAKAGRDFKRVNRRYVFKRGARKVQVPITIYANHRSLMDYSFALKIHQPEDVKIETQRISLTIVNADPPLPMPHGLTLG